MQVLSAVLSIGQAMDPTGGGLKWPPSSSYCAFSGVTCDQQVGLQTDGRALFRQPSDIGGLAFDCLSYIGKYAF